MIMAFLIDTLKVNRVPGDPACPLFLSANSTLERPKSVRGEDENILPQYREDQKA